MMVSHQENSPFLLDPLFCEEEHWDDDTESIEAEREGDDISFSHHSLNSEPFLQFLGQEFLYGDDDEELKSLLDKEQENELYNDLKESPSVAKARVEAVEWMLDVIGYYSFSALTAVLAINYLDRFLHRFQSQSDKPWMTQLAAVACLSLAAKVDETDVPLLLDLQVVESKYVFEPKTIQRMEILVLSTLEWKMNPVIPLSFLDYIARRLALKTHICREFLKRCEGLILSIICDSRFMRYLPSALATATMLYVITSIEPCIGLEYQDQLVGILGINKEKVHDCCRQIEEVATSVRFNTVNKRKFGSLPGSPKGVFDVSFSSDSSNDSWAVASSSSVSSSPQPLLKKIKAESPETIQFSDF